MEHKITVTLAQIKKRDPCGQEKGCGKGWDLLTTNLGEDYGMDTPVTFEQIIKSNGLDDALWALGCLGDEHHALLRHYAVDCAESVKHLMNDERSLKALEVARLHADGKASDSELAATWAAAGTAAWSAAWSAVRAAAMNAAWDAARDAAWAAAWAAARYTAVEAFAELLIEYTRTGERVMNAQEIIKKHIEKEVRDGN